MLCTVNLTSWLSWWVNWPLKVITKGSPLNLKYQEIRISEGRTNYYDRGRQQGINMSSSEYRFRRSPYMGKPQYVEFLEEESSGVENSEEKVISVKKWMKFQEQQ